MGEFEMWSELSHRLQVRRVGLTSASMLKPETPELFKRLIEITAKLRSPDGCPWDRAQTPETIAPYLLEETHEALEAIYEGDRQALKDELGDLLLEVTLLARMAEEEGSFDIGDSLNAICEKLVRRHPHVFGPSGSEKPDIDGVGRKWSEIKALEKPERSVLGGVPKTLPALHRARRVSEKAAGVGFDWSGALDVIEKVEEEIAELKKALSEQDAAGSAEELGDILFAIVNLCRHLGVDPEKSLHGTTDKFLKRFEYIEKKLAETGRSPHDSTPVEMNGFWDEAKKSK